MESRTEAFYKKQSEMSDLELYDKVRDKLSKLCKTGGKSFSMSIPPNVDDDDMRISELLKRFKKLSL